MYSGPRWSQPPAHLETIRRATARTSATCQRASHVVELCISWVNSLEMPTSENLAAGARCERKFKNHQLA